MLSTGTIMSSGTFNQNDQNNYKDDLQQRGFMHGKESQMCIGMFCKYHGIKNSKGFTNYDYSTSVFVSITEAIL